MRFDLHTHTTASHGTGTAVENIEAAIALGLEKIAISDHAMSHISYGIRDVDKYLRELEIQKNTFSNKIQVLTGIECNLIGEHGETEMTRDLLENFDVRICGYHKFIRTRGLSYTSYCYLTARKDIARNTSAVLYALETGYFHILAHPGYAMPVDIARVARACRDTNTLFEINEKHTEMNVEMLKTAAGEGTKFILSSDAHCPGNVGKVSRAEALAEKAGITDLVVNYKRSGQA